MKYLSLWPSERNVRANNSLDFFRQFDNLFEDFEGVGRNMSRELSSFYPALDIEESDKDYQISLDIPGIKKEDVKIELKDRSIVISGERKREEKTSTSGVNRLERTHGQFTRTLQLPHNVDVTKIDANYENGVLKLMIPKSEDAKPRLIDIK
ncbi:MAG: Hsp20/alpha crystallin family protein [Bdellovibrionota bacterium]